MYHFETPCKSPAEDAELGTVRMSQQPVEIPDSQRFVDSSLGQLSCLCSSVTASRSACSSFRSSASGNVLLSLATFIAWALLELWQK
ncbi:hypothetical protein TNCV_3914441 [Trichonephila clavipes]|nr:hypothetical protein TNCV_3914441 [Trichonephila clavipes]